MPVKRGRKIIMTDFAHQRIQCFVSTEGESGLGHPTGERPCNLMLGKKKAEACKATTLAYYRLSRGKA